MNARSRFKGCAATREAATRAMESLAEALAGSEWFAGVGIVPAPGGVALRVSVRGAGGGGSLRASGVEEIPDQWEGFDVQVATI